MRSSLRKLLLLGAGMALPISLMACGNDPPEDTAFDGSERMSRPALAALAPMPRPTVRSRGAIARHTPVGASAAPAYDGSVAPVWQPSWATADPLPLVMEPQEEDWVPDVAGYHEPEPPAPPQPTESAGLVVASLLENFIGSVGRDDAGPHRPPRWRRGDGWRRDRHPPRNRGERPDRPDGYGERPPHRPPPVGGARPDRPERPGPGPAEPAQSLPRAVPLVRAPAADFALESGGPPAARVEREEAIATIDRDEIRAAREAARRDEERRAASARRETEEREARARQEEMQRQAAREAEAQRAREAEQQRLAAEARRAAAEAQRLAAAEQQARAAREQAEQEARLREQRQAMALARRDDPPVAQPQPQPQDATAAQPAPIRGPAARLAELEGRPQARGKPMAGARGD